MWLQVYSIVERRMSNVGFQEGRSGGGGGGVGGVGGVGGHGGAPPPSREYVTHCSLGTVLLQPSLCVIQRTGVPAWVLQSERTLKEWQRGSALQLLLPCATQSAVVVVQESSASTAALQSQCLVDVHFETDVHVPSVRV